MPGSSATWLGPSVTTRRSISTNSPESGRFDQSEFAVTWNSTIKPWPCFAAVTSGVPSARRAQTSASLATVGSASTCRLTFTSSGTARPRKGLLSSNGASGCGVLQESEPPSERPPRRKRHRQQFVAALLEPRAGEANEHAARLDPGFELFLRAGDELADIGQHDGRDLLLDQVVNGVGDVALARRDDVGVGRERALHVIEGREQRLRGFARFARDDADALPLRAGVEQIARRPPNARRQSRCGPPDCGSRAADRIGPWSRARPLADRESGFAERLAAAGERPDGAGARPLGAAQDAGGKLAAFACSLSEGKRCVVPLGTKHGRGCRLRRQAWQERRRRRRRRHSRARRRATARCSRSCRRAPSRALRQARRGRVRKALGQDRRRVRAPDRGSRDR